VQRVAVEEDGQTLRQPPRSSALPAAAAAARDEAGFEAMGVVIPESEVSPVRETPLTDVPMTQRCRLADGGPLARLGDFTESHTRADVCLIRGFAGARPRLAQETFQLRLCRCDGSAAGSHFTLQNSFSHFANGDAEAHVTALPGPERRQWRTLYRRRAFLLTGFFRMRRPMAAAAGQVSIADVYPEEPPDGIDSLVDSLCSFVRLRLDAYLAQSTNY
jgi:hypothetical protein